MKKVLIKLYDSEVEEEYVVDVPDDVKDDDLVEIIEDIRKGDYEKYGLPEDWTYDEVMDVIAKKYNIKRLDFEFWPYRL